MTKCHFQLSSPRPKYRSKYTISCPHNPVTLGDALRKQRLDSSLTQKQAAEKIGTSISNINNWETNRRHVSLQFRTKVYDFIGFCPCDVSLSLGRRLRERREYYGLLIRKIRPTITAARSSAGVAKRNMADGEPCRKTMQKTAERNILFVRFNLQI